ncbi:MAG TPA: response regulator [Sedimenticola thiotaurini]|uniref:Response regulator n=1 Tax=Sedimenticola thiotaurini TaxID=1543721 RepID=A0A831W4A0_9GAMM|nr:response regulator [Sedimenticola thiotaurini]
MNGTEKRQQPLLLLVDDTPENLDILRGILGSDYRLRIATSGPLALKVIERQQPDLILLDVMMPGMDGHEVCRILKSDPDTAPIPVIFVTAMAESEDEELGLRLGAVDYLTKPVQPAVVRARVATHLALADQQRSCRRMVEERTRELEASQRAAVYMLGEAGHFNDTDTGVHIWRMAAYSAALARALHWPVERASLLELAAPMHDTGKIGIPDAILKAPRKLTPEEWQVMRSHSEIGHRILSQSSTPLFTLAAEIALCHHEKWDGSGYPRGLTGREIPESARIVGIADVFDALTMDRPYKEPWPLDRAFGMIEEEAGRHFDPDMVATFLEIRPRIEKIRLEWEERERTAATPSPLATAAEAAR